MAMWDESKHKRGQPGNAGQFAPNGGATRSKDAKEKTKMAIRRYSDDPTKDISEYDGTSEDKPFINLLLFGVDYSKYTSHGLRSSLKKHKEQLQKHRYKIAHPEEYYSNWDSMSEQERAGRLHQWEKEINNFKTQIQNIQTEISKRSEYDGN